MLVGGEKMFVSQMKETNRLYIGYYIFNGNKGKTLCE